MLRGSYYNPIGFIDDDANLKGSVIHGVPILGGVLNISHLVKSLIYNLLLLRFLRQVQHR